MTVSYESWQVWNGIINDYVFDRMGQLMKHLCYNQGDALFEEVDL